MIGIEVLFTIVSDLDRQDLQRWIHKSWVRPESTDGHYVFRDIDVARVRLIQELRDGMQVNEDALPIVLLLLDQLYDTRRRMREVAEAFKLLAPEELQRRLQRHLMAGDDQASDPLQA